ncbi:MAG TPA: serine/threonine-protein kinase [Burkholderiaceae bacterium]|nr:serine/threonine-protein kinase [Burkholderiaceae bacterium]
MTIGTIDLAALSTLLAQALELPVGERDAWLTTLDAQHAHLRRTLQKLLARVDSTEIDDLLRTLPKLDVGGDSDGERATGERVGPYRLLQVLGRGGMGTVWLAERTDDAPSRRVALKLPLIASQPQMRERLLRERDVLAALEHPGIARLYDAGVDTGGQPYLALEYIDGRPIDAYCRERALDIESRLRVFVQVARAVAFAHARLVLHRDLKPTNILVTPDGQPHLLDFGVAKLLEDGGTRETELTQIRGRALTPGYASPEQILGLPMAVASDVYSLGVVLYELLTGQRPYKLRRDSRGALEDAIVAVEPQLPSAAVADRTIRRQLAGDLDTIVLKALKKLPEDRYGTVDALVDDIERLLEGRPVLARADSAWYRARKFVARHRGAVGAASGIALALVVGAGVAIWQAGFARAEAARAGEINRFVLSLFETADPYHTAQSDLRVVDLLTAARARIEADLAGRPELQVELLVTVGNSLYGIGALEEAQKTLQRALEIAGPQALMRPSPAAEQAAIKLIDVLGSRGDYKTSESLLNQWEAALRARPPGLGLAGILDQRAGLYLNTGRARNAIPVATEALKVARRVPEATRRQVAGLISDLARAHYYADDNEAALPVAREAETEFSSIDTPDARLQAMRTRTLIAFILRDLSRFDEAAQMLGEQLPRLREALGEHAGEYGVALGEYARLQALRGDLGGAASSIAAAFTAVGTNTSERTLYFWERMAGEIALQQRDIAGARPHLERARAHAAQWPMANSQLLVEMLLWQAEVLDAKPAPMPSALRSIADDAAKSPGDARLVPLRAGVQCTAGYDAIARGNTAHAIESFERAVTTYEAINDKWFWYLVPWCLTGHARALLATGALDQAESALDRALQLQMQRSVPATPARAETLVALAQLHLRRGRSEDAVRAAREADAFWQAFRPDSRQAAEAESWLGRALIAHGDRAEGLAALCRADALALVATHHASPPLHGEAGTLR